MQYKQCQKTNLNLINKKKINQNHFFIIKSINNSSIIIKYLNIFLIKQLNIILTKNLIKISSQLIKINSTKKSVLLSI